MDIYIDGSSMGNPGDAGIGIIFYNEEHPVKNVSKYIGKQTNNIAEYTALLVALEEALQMELKTVNVFSDSELLCKQLKGEYKVKNNNLKMLFENARKLIQKFEQVHISHIPREKNCGADKLARLAVKKERSKIDGVTALNAKSVREESPSSIGHRSG